MRPTVFALVATLFAAAASYAAPDRSSQYFGWRYGPITGSATLTITSPRLVCSSNARSEKRIIRGTYRLAYSGSSRRRTRADGDISYNTAAGGPAGGTEGISFRARRSLDEVVHIRRITFDAAGDEICTLEERRCSRTDIGQFGGIASRMNVRMLRGARVGIHHPYPAGVSPCTTGVSNFAWDYPRRRTIFPLALFNRPQGVLRFALSTRVTGETETGAPITGSLVYGMSVTIRRMRGTPLARCKVC